MSNRRLCFAAACVFALGINACAPSDPIDPGGATFDAIAPEASITLTGTEPFWGLGIEPDGQGAYIARFSSPDDIDGGTFPVTRFAGNNGLGFSGTLEERAVQVALTPGECSDGMSDRSYPFTATVTFGEATLFGCGHTSDAPFTEDSPP